MGLWDLSRAAWRDAFETWQQHTSLFTLLFIATLIVEVCANRWVAAPMAELLKGGHVAAAHLRFLPANLLMAVIKAGLSAPIAVAVHRSILLGDPSERIEGPEIWRWAIFAGWLLCIDLIVLIPSFLVQMIPVLKQQGGPAVALIYAVPSLLLFIATLVIALRLVLIFPAVATDQPIPWRISWTLTDGHWWGMFGTFLFNMMGIVLLGAIPLGLASAIGHSIFGVLPGIVDAALGVLSVAIMAAVASWLYREYGDAAEEQSPW